MTNDSIAALLTALRNAATAGKHEVAVEKTKLNKAIIGVLTQAGYLEGSQNVQIEGREKIKLQLRYINNRPALRTLRRISKPGTRRYTQARAIPRPMGGFGIVVLSTPKGVMSGADASRKGLGGEILCEVS